KTPGDTWGGRVAGDAATYNSHTIDLSLEGPIASDKLTARLSLIDIHKGGMYRDNAQDSVLGERNTDEGTLVLYAKPSDRLHVKFVFDYSKLDDGPPAAYNMAPIKDGTLPSYSNCNPKGAASPLTWFCGQLPWTDLGVARVGIPSVYDAAFVNTLVKPF